MLGYRVALLVGVILLGEWKDALRGVDAVTAPPDGIDVPWWDRHNPFWEAVMSEITTIGLDLAKNVFQRHCQVIFTWCVAVCLKPVTRSSRGHSRPRG